jgi:hypothetical protein
MMTENRKLFAAMFDCICRGNGISLEEGIAQLSELYAERTVDDKPEMIVCSSSTMPEAVPEAISDRVKYTAPKFKLPWTGKAVSEWCQGLRHHAGLMSQCTMKPKKGGFCDTCQKSIDKKGHPDRGTVKMRIEADQQDKPYKYEGKSPVKFATVMKKQKITREEAIAEATKFGLTIPDEEFVVEDKKKGRPTKQAKKVSPLSAIVNKVVEEGSTASSDTIEVNHVSEPVPQKKPPVPSELMSEEYDYDAETEDESTNVQVWIHGGKTYLKMTDGCAVYDVTTHEPIGSYDVNTDTIKPCVDEDTDEEEN